MHGGSGRSQGRRVNVSTPTGQLIVRRSVTKNMVAEATGIPLRTLHRILAGQPPSPDQARRLAAAFEVPVAVILGGPER